MPAAFPHPLVLKVLTASGTHPRLAWLTWATDGLDEIDALQVVVDGELFDVVDPHRPGIWLRPSRPNPRVELRAVSAASAWDDHELTDTPPRLSIHRDPSLPLDTHVRITTDTGVTLLDHPLWDATAPRVGFGSLFGLGHFGFDDAPSPGLGETALGLGPLGYDQPPLHFTLPPSTLPVGTHRLLIDTDHTPPTEVDVTVDQLPSPPTNLAHTDDLITWD